MLTYVNYASIKHRHTGPGDPGPAFAKFTAWVRTKGMAPLRLLEKHKYIYKALVEPSSFTQPVAWHTKWSLGSQ